mmetsp:Transcript_28190/g.45311  ORF Transcript_28190/g.45311 Transcript_28190/m.45311 type:complete len:620 (-) Transcript_28190:726-2585(-)
MDPQVCSLNSRYPKHVGLISLLFLLGNAGLQVYSHLGLSAVIKSNVQPGNETQGPAVPEPTATCTDPDFVTQWNASFQYSYSASLNGCGLEAYTGNLPGFYSCMKGYGVNTTDDCLNCYTLPVKCAINKCGSVCIINRASEECLNCTRTICNPQFENCTGATLVPDEELGTPPPTTEKPTLAKPGVDDLQVVYEISFVSSINDAIKGGAYAIAIVIIVFSGIWPYGKNVIMFCAWYIPMTWKTRSIILKNLTRLAKWSLVDVFAVVIILSGIRIDKQLPNNSYLIVVAESRVAIWTFCIAAIWDLVQGEWMRYMHIMALEEYEFKRTGVRVEDSVDVNLCLANTIDLKPAQDSITHCSRFGRTSQFTFMFVQLGLCVASTLIPVIEFTIHGAAAGLEGDNVYSYSAWTIATSLLSNEAIEYNTHIGGTVFLIVMYVLMSILIPIFQFVSIILFTMVKPAWLCCGKVKSLKEYAFAIDLIGGFACQDVFVLSFIVVTAEWDKLIEKTIGNMAQDYCEGVENCFSMTSRLMPGIYVMIAAFIMGWFSEVFFTYTYAQIFHPIEQTCSANALFHNLPGPCGIHKPKVRLYESEVTEADTQQPTSLTKSEVKQPIGETKLSYV